MKSKNFLKLFTVMTAGVMVLALAACGKANGGNDTGNGEKTPGIGIHHAVIEVENYGSIELELDGDTAPITVDNFMKLAREGFYDGLTFHRVMDQFMIQGGDPKGNGTGGSTPIKGEFSHNGIENNISHKRGVISMARLSNNMDSASCQFFIMHADYTGLDGDYAAFGHVTKGIEVVDAIVANTAMYGDRNGTINDKSKQAVITTVKIVD